MTSKNAPKKNKKKVYRQGSTRWCVGMDQVTEDSDDLEAGYISSDESARGIDLAERIRVKPSRDIWTIEEIQYVLRQLPYAETISALVEDGLYEKVINLAAQPEERKTAALWACWLGRSSLLARLLKLGIDPNWADDAGRTCLHLSCLVGSEECVKLLLEHKADPNRWECRHEMKATPLHCAASAKSLACVKILLEHGADVNAGLNEHSPLHYAVLSDAPEVVSLLLQAGACPDTPQVFTETPLHVAASLGSAKCTKLLLDAGADVRAAFGTGRATALHLAAEDGHAECARLLLEHNARIDCPNYRGQTPLHLAALAQSVEVVELLVGRHADVHAKDVDGRTPLHGSIVRGARACDVARMLLSVGADPNAPDEFGYTPLHIAALNEFSACVLLLLDYGGDLTLRTNGGVSALSFVVRRVPDVVPRYLCKFDDAVHMSEHELGDVDCEFTIDFRPLVPCLTRGEAELLLAFIEVGRKDVLKHPVAETFLFLKWRRIRKFFVLSFIYHALFITLYSIYILQIYLCAEVTCDVPTYLRPVQYLIILLNLCFLCKEIFQACLDWSAYIRQWENWLQCIIIIGVFLCTAPNWEMDNGVIRSNTSGWQHDIAAVTIFFCWLELMMIIGRFPTFGLYVQMFTTVTVNFATFLLAYSCLLIAFGLAFSVLFSNYPAFQLPAGLVKTVMMMSGELEYEDIFYNNCTNSQIQYPLTAHGMFLIFVLLVTVILTNLLVGLAVSDIQALQVSAGLDRLVRTTQLVAHLESMLFSSLLSCAPKQLIAVLRWGALLTASHTRTLNIRPNDPRENRIPKELITSIYGMVASRKDTKRSIRKNNNYECRIKCKEEPGAPKPQLIKRKSNLFDRYSSESQQVERRKRTTSGSDNRNRPISMNISAIQEICMVDIKTQLTELTKKINKLVEVTDSRLNIIEKKLDSIPPS
ncbi:transient receptor potential channel pyrexia isoform X1 [Choristoneura fumiferana]|uniref:transient receptor potential channel pyrexia isoform X1 n=1 Tax=Choristoneura fumiferana TaxID=7141 RepID=UPI003D15C723